MPGVPFQKGFDARRNTTKGSRKAPSATARSLAQAERQGSIDRLVALRDKAEDESIQLKAAELLLCFADGRPGPSVQEPPGEDDDDADDAAGAAMMMPVPEEAKQ